MVQSKFDRLFETKRAEPPAAPEITPPVQPLERSAPLSVPPSVRAIGRPPGKRSDPAWKQFPCCSRRKRSARPPTFCGNGSRGWISPVSCKVF
jgi:hypothetical protein